MGAVSDDELTEAILMATRALCDIAERSLAGAVTLPQFRALVVLASGGPSSLKELAASLGVAPSTATRMCDRLFRLKLMSRGRHPVDSRALVLRPTAAGQALVDEVMDRRRTEVARVLQAIPGADRAGLVAALAVLTKAAEELPETPWSRGWDLEPPSAGEQAAAMTHDARGTV